MKKMLADKERVKALLTESVALLCKISISYHTEVEVEGLIGITIDKRDVFLVGLKETISKQLSEVQIDREQQPLAQQYEKPEVTQSRCSRRSVEAKQKCKQTGGTEGSNTPKIASKVTRSEVKTLLTQAVTLLCKSSIKYESTVKIEGLVGITVDKGNVILVTLNQVISGHSSSEVQLGQQQQSSPSQNPPSLTRRKRRCKLAEVSTSPKKPKKLSGQSHGQSHGHSRVSAEGSHPGGNECDEGVVGTSEYVGQRHQAKENRQDTQGDSTDSEQMFPHLNEKMLDFSNVDSKIGIMMILPRCQEQTGEARVSVKLEQCSGQQEEDSGLFSFDSLAPEQKWSPSCIGVMQQSDGMATSAAKYSQQSDGMQNNTATFSMPQLSPAPQLSTQVGV